MDKVSLNGVMIDRQYVTDHILDIEAHHNEHDMSKFRFIRFCGIVMEQMSCDIVTGDGIFVPQVT